MLTFFDNYWHVISAFLVFSGGLIFCVFQYRFFRVPYARALAIYLWHTTFCILYFFYSLDNTADATEYYLLPFHKDIEFQLGTFGIFYVTSLFSKGLGLSYGGVFLVFNIAGFLGMLSLDSAIREVASSHSRLVRQFSLIFIFLPGLSFWSSAIGKDALTFAAAGLATWAALNIGRRWPAMAIAILFFLLARPHMAALLLVSLTFAMLFVSNLKRAYKIGLIVGTVFVTYFAFSFALEYIQLNQFSSVALLSFIADFQGRNLDGGASIDLTQMSFANRMFTYVFRPLFFDTIGFLSLAASFENLLLFSAFFSCLIGIILRPSSLGSFELLFYMIFVCASWIFLSNTTANLGISLRQKWMFLPMLTVLMVSFTPKPRRAGDPH